MLFIFGVHVQHLDSQLCQDESIMVSYNAASDAEENCMPRPSQVFYFLLKNKQTNKYM